MDVLETLPRPTQGSKYIILIAERYYKLTQAVPSARTSATQVGNVFLDYWIVPFGIPSYVLTNNGPSFVRKFFATVCGYLNVEDLTTIAYH